MWKVRGVSSLSRHYNTCTLASVWSSSVTFPPSTIWNREVCSPKQRQVEDCFVVLCLGKRAHGRLGSKVMGLCGLTRQHNPDNCCHQGMAYAWPLPSSRLSAENQSLSLWLFPLTKVLNFKLAAWLFLLIIEGVFVMLLLWLSDVLFLKWNKNNFDASHVSYDELSYLQ